MRRPGRCPNPPSSCKEAGHGYAAPQAFDREDLKSRRKVTEPGGRRNGPAVGLHHGRLYREMTAGSQRAPLRAAMSSAVSSRQMETIRSISWGVISS